MPESFRPSHRKTSLLTQPKLPCQMYALTERSPVKIYVTPGKTFYNLQDLQSASQNPILV